MRVAASARYGLFACLLVLCGSTARAQTLETNEIVVTATRTARDIQSVPATVYRVDATQGVRNGGARTTPELLEGLPSTLLQKTAQGQSSPYLRGFTGFRTLCLIDGVRLNNSVFRDGPNQYWGTVDPYSLRAGELVMGPASVLYGSDAVGGTFNALPLESPDYTGSAVWEKQLFYRTASADRSQTGRIQLGTRLTENLGFIGGYTIRDFDDVRGGHKVGKQPHTGYEEQAYDIRLDYTPDADSAITFVHQSVSQDDAWRTHKTVYGIDWEGLSVGDEKKHVFDQQRDLTYLKYRHENLNGPVDRMDWTLSRQVQGEDRDRIKADSTADEQNFDVTTYGGSLQLESDTAAGQWVYGGEYYRDIVNSSTYKFKADGSFDKKDVQGPVADDAIYESVGLYAEDTLHLLQNQLDVVPGLRYTWCRADADTVKDTETGKPFGMTGDWDAFTSSLRLLHPLTADRHHILFAGVSQGFRAPNLSDLTRLDTARSNEIETPVDHLDPEDYVSYETGIKSRVEWLTTQISYYYTTIDNMIVRAPTGRVIDGYDEVTKKNSGDGYVQGVEWTETIALSKVWSTWFTASWMDGEVDAYPTSDAVQERDTISRLMPPSGQAGLRWQREDKKYWWQLESDLANKADQLSADDKRDTQRIPPGGTPGYVVFHARAGATVCRNLALSLGVENLLDEDYRIHGSGVNEPGRNVILSAACKF
jgi:hemoglobin/transferrin/lactoferrin receptor protein